MYAVHIRNVSPTSTLRDTVPIHAWSGHKPDISYLHIFGSIAYANIPKKVRGGKLEATSIKCRLLGWWADETKGYRLEETETGKLITVRDVHFVEDTKPDDLAVIENDEPQHPMDDLVDLSEEGGSGGQQQILAKERSSSPTSESKMSSLTPMESSDFEPEECFKPEKNEPVLTPVEPVPEPQQA